MGIEAYSCDIKSPAINADWHYQFDIRWLLKQLPAHTWGLIIAHPECRYLANSGSQWLYNKDKTRNESRWISMENAAKFFKWVVELDCPRLCIENPVQHRHARKIIEHDYTQIIHPWQFGEEFEKTTCLWLKGLPELEPTAIVGKGEKHITRGGKVLPAWYNKPPSPERSAERAVTFNGIARAMADQWGKLLV